MDALIDGKLSKPANTLVKKVSGAIGMLYEPTHIRRVAKAKADAELMLANPGVELSDLRKRAFQRWFEEEERRQTNIESVLEKTMPGLRDNADPEAVDDDWIVAFFNKVRMISDQEMQVLWAHLLAGEANDPGRFARQTINILSCLGRTDARLFTRLCRFCILIGTQPFLLIFGQADASVYRRHGIYATALHTIDSLGLIKYATMIESAASPRPGTVIRYHAEEFVSRGNLNVGSAHLTRAGRELYALCGATPVRGFFAYAKGEMLES